MSGDANQPNTTIHVGNLPATVSVPLLHAAFIPFGPILDIHLPADPDAKTPRHRGFAFIEYADQEDALDAIDNMHWSDLEGVPIKVQMAKAFRHEELGSRAVWTDDKWLRDQGYLEENKQEEEEKQEINGNDVEETNQQEVEPDVVVVTTALEIPAIEKLRKRQLGS